MQRGVGYLLKNRSGELRTSPDGVGGGWVAVNGSTQGVCEERGKGVHCSGGVNAGWGEGWG